MNHPGSHRLRPIASVYRPLRIHSHCRTFESEFAEESGHAGLGTGPYPPLGSRSGKRYIQLSQRLQPMKSTNRRSLVNAEPKSLRALSPASAAELKTRFNDVRLSPIHLSSLLSRKLQAVFSAVRSPTKPMTRDWMSWLSKRTGRSAALTASVSIAAEPSDSVRKVKEQSTSTFASSAQSRLRPQITPSKGVPLWMITIRNDDHHRNGIDEAI